MQDTLDAAALEAFAVSARALTEFFWADHVLRNDGSRCYPEDSRAPDWFFDEPDPWDPGPQPSVLKEFVRRVGWGVAHVSYRRIDPQQEWGWWHLEVSHHLASRFYDFARDAPTGRVTADFYEGVMAEVMDYREQSASQLPFAWLDDPAGPVGTPGHATLIADLR